MSHTLTITLEHAITSEELTWGLMGRYCLEENHGMTFNYPFSQRQRCWMFNCFINLSIAFLDEDHRILEIYEMQAHPEWMDPHRPISDLSDMKLYPLDDPIVLQFQKEVIHSQYKAKYALEMRQGWFSDNFVRIGDHIFWDIYHREGKVMRSSQDLQSGQSRSLHNLQQPSKK